MGTVAALALAAALAMLLQTTVFPFVPGLPVVPDLILVLTVHLGIRHPSAGGAFGAFLLGYFLDTFSGTLPGMHAFALTAVFAAVHLVGRQFWMETGLPVMVLVFVGAWVRELAGTGLMAFVADRAPVWQHVLRYGMLESLMAALVAPWVFAAVRWETRVLRLS
jgi:rod shape-determining protein MreD